MYRRNNKKKRTKFLIFLLFIVLGSVILAKIFLTHPDNHIYSTKLPFGRPTIPITPTNTPIPQNSPGLTSAVESALEGTHGSYGIVVKNLQTGESYYQNATVSYQSGSLYKLWVMAVVFQEIQDKTLNANDSLSKDLTILYKEFNFEPDGSEQSTGQLTLTINDALYQMITISSNNAALLLTDKISPASITEFLQKYTFTTSRVSKNNTPPVTTAYDIAKFLDMLYTKQLANADNTEKMLTLLKEQKLNDKIPKYLPDDIVVAHKTGELDNFTHDAAIIYTPNGNYILVVLSESDDTDLAKERISLVSQAVYNYFSTEEQNTSPSPSQEE